MGITEPVPSSIDDRLAQPSERHVAGDAWREAATILGLMVPMVAAVFAFGALQALVGRLWLVALAAVVVLVVQLVVSVGDPGEPPRRDGP